MPTLKNRAPRLCCDRGRYLVHIDGKPHRLGTDPAHARELYDRLIAEWLSNGRRMPATTAESPQTVTVQRIILEYWRYVKRRYQPGKASTIRQALRITRELYGSTPANEFGPKRLRVVRDRFIAREWARPYVNEQVRWLRSMFKWASSHELVDVRVYRALQTVEPLRKGEAMREGRTVKPVPREQLRRVRRLLPRPVRGLVNLQLLTGARPGELVGLRPVDIDTSGAVWRYCPADHKTAHHDHDRTIFIGPRAQRLLRLFMGPDRPVDRPIFSPREAACAARRKGARGSRRPGQKPTQRRTGRTVGDAYDVASYRRAIHRACREAYPAPGGATPAERRAHREAHRWGPHRLRHNAGTAIRRQFGAEVARVILGHRHLAVTEVYAERDQKAAAEAVRMIG